MYNLVFDAAYRGLVAATVVILLATIARATRVGRTAGDRGRRRLAGAIGCAALGVLASDVAGVGLNEVRRATGDVFYQVVHFLVFYLGFGLVLWGAHRVASDVAADRAGFVGRVGQACLIATWLLFVAAVAGSSLMLIEAAGEASSAGGFMPQQAAFFSPLFIALALAASWVCAATITAAEADRRRRLLAWFGAFAVLGFVGLLREATIIPSSGEPLVDLALAFGPLTAATACLYMAGHSIPDASSMPASSVP